MTRRDELGLLIRTAVHLRPAQLVHRARLRTQRAALSRYPELGRRLLTDPVSGSSEIAGAAVATPDGPGPAAFSSRAGWPSGFAPLDTRLAGLCPTPAELASGRITLLGLTRPLNWNPQEAPQLWRFHLHYWDWAWSLTADPDRAAARALFARLWRSWRASCAFGRGDAWLPYPAALRAWSWCGLHRHLVAGTDLEPEFSRELAAHAGFLRRHLESDVGGNHLVKDLKALAGLGVFLGDERLLARALDRLRRQLGVQVLPDGGHYERAPAYHCQVLADLIDVAALVSAAGRAPEPELGAAITRMRRWLAAVLSPDGAVPLLNDGYPVPGVLVAALLPDQAADPAPLRVLPDTGLVRAATGGWHLLADVGEPCPAELPAHAHADTLGCLVHADGAPLLVDTGTSTYAPGPVRGYERSTAAHNTAEIDGCDSTEVWGAFRAGRRARVHGVAADDGGAGSITAEAAHDGYRRHRGRPVHHRRWSLTSAGLRVDDELTGGGRHAIVVRWHLAPGSSVLHLADRGAVITAGRSPEGLFHEEPDRRFEVTVAGSHPFWLMVEHAPVAAGFGHTTQAPVLTCRIDSVLPARISTRWRRAGTTWEAA